MPKITKHKFCHVCANLGRGVTYEISLLGADDGERKRFVEMETGSSVFEESSSYKRRYVEKTLETLDSLLDDIPHTKPGISQTGRPRVRT